MKIAEEKICPHNKPPQETNNQTSKSPQQRIGITLKATTDFLSPISCFYSFSCWEEMNVAK
jgi:hypothetical protein